MLEVENFLNAFVLVFLGFVAGRCSELPGLTPFLLVLLGWQIGRLVVGLLINGAMWLRGFEFFEVIESDVE